MKKPHDSFAFNLLTADNWNKILRRNDSSEDGGNGLVPPTGHQIEAISTEQLNGQPSV